MATKKPKQLTSYVLETVVHYSRTTGLPVGVTTKAVRSGHRPAYKKSASMRVHYTFSYSNGSRGSARGLSRVRQAGIER